MAKPKNLGQQIIQLRDSGKTYDEIKVLLKCSKGTIAYHCGINQKQKTKDRKMKDPFRTKISRRVDNFQKLTLESKPYKPNVKNFRERLSQKICTFTGKDGGRMFTLEELLTRIGDNPICELTGRLIDIEDTRSWELDHKIPRSRGGDNSINNVAILSKVANQAKRDLTDAEFIQLCKDVLIYKGYKIS